MSTAQNALPEGLLADVEVMLGVTWESEQTDAQYTEWILGGMDYLNDKLGAAGDYMVPGKPRSLLFEYVRYARDAALDVFESNYRSLLLAMQNNRKVSAYEAATL